MKLTVDPTPDRQTVTPEGERLTEPIEGVCRRAAVTHTDERGSLTEILDPRWGFGDEPIVYVYTASIRPGGVKGWVVHRLQDDRLFFGWGSARVVLYDAREGSPTEGRVNEVFFDVHNRGLLRIPAGVVHAVQNLGTEDLVYLNLPTRAYEHATPDKERLPLDSEEIPFRFSPTPR